MGAVSSCLCCCCCECCLPKKKTKDFISSLRAAQKRDKTVTGKPVNKITYSQFHSRTQLEHIKVWHKKKDLLWKDIFCKPLNDFTQITACLYLTGMGGICKENIQRYDIKCIINATYELPKFIVNDIESLRIPVEDSYSEDLYPYFKDVSSKIEANRKNDIKTVLYCMSGISRSPTLVMAYIMKYKKMTLKEAFVFVLKQRPVVRPNRHFLRSLWVYEKELYKKNFDQMIDVGSKAGVKQGSVPDFALKYYLDTSETGTDSDQIDSSEIDESIDMKLSAKYEEPELSHK